MYRVELWVEEKKNQQQKISVNKKYGQGYPG